MVALNDLYSAKTTAHGKAQAIADRARQEGRNLSQEERQQMDAYFAEIDQADAQIETETRAQRLQQISAGLNTPTGRQSAPGGFEGVRSSLLQPGESNRILRGWMGWGLMQTDLSLVNRSSEVGISLPSSSIEVRTMLAGTANVGQQLVPQGYLNHLERELLDFAPIMEYAKLLDTDSGNDIPVPKMTDATALTVVAENADAQQATPVTGSVTMKAHELRTIEPFSIALLQDAGYNFEAELEAVLGERYGRSLDSYFMIGTGSGEPQGLATYAATTTNQVRTGGNSSITSVNMLDLQFKVARAYRRRGVYIIQDGPFKELRKEVDGQGRLIWQPGQNGQPNTLHERPYLITDYLQELGATNRKLAIFADLSRYLVRRVRKIEFQKLVELYAAKGMIGLSAVWRVDAKWIGTANAIAELRTPAS